MTQNCEPAIMQEIYAVKRQIHEETKGMSPSERCKYFNDRTEPIIASLGLKTKYANADKPDIKE